MNQLIAVATMSALLLLGAAPAKAEHCTSKWSQKNTVDSKYDRVVWAEIGGDEYAKLTVAIATAVASSGAASPAVFAVFFDSLGEVISEVAEDIGKQAAATYFNDVLESGEIVTIDNIVLGRQVWSRKECVPSCDNPWIGCITLPATNAFYAAWDY